MVDKLWTTSRTNSGSFSEFLSLSVFIHKTIHDICVYCLGFCTQLSAGLNLKPKKLNQSSTHNPQGLLLRLLFFKQLITVGQENL